MGAAAALMGLECFKIITWKKKCTVSNSSFFLVFVGPQPLKEVNRTRGQRVDQINAQTTHDIFSSNDSLTVEFTFFTRIFFCHTIRYEEPPPKMDRFHWSSIAKETRVDWTNCWYSITVYSVGQQKKNKTEKSFSNIAASQFCFSRSNKSTTTLQL
jgi:hypothetical protein